MWCWCWWNKTEYKGHSRNNSQTGLLEAARLGIGVDGGGYGSDGKDEGDEGKDGRRHK